MQAQTIPQAQMHGLSGGQCTHDHGQKPVWAGCWWPVPAPGPGAAGMGIVPMGIGDEDRDGDGDGDAGRYLPATDSGKVWRRKGG